MNAVGMTDPPSAARSTKQNPARELAPAELVSTASPSDSARLPTSELAAVGLLHPTWDRDRLELRVGHHVLRQFKIPSPHEEMVLAALEELHWPERIDDPSPAHEHPLNLEQTIDSLNRRQRPPLVDFCLDATGQGIAWKFSPAAQKLTVA
jgi:hypothetical protein